MSGSNIGDPSLFAIALTLGWLAGVRVYLPVFAVGLAGALGWVPLPMALHAIASPWVIGACALLMAIDCVADKVPGLDSVWDLMHTLVRIPVGAYLTAATLSRDGRLGGGALFVGATLAFASHAIKTATRMLINTSPEPLSNWSASLAEDILTVTALALLLVYPWIALWVAIGALLLVALGALWSFRSRLHFEVRKTQAVA